MPESNAQQLFFMQQAVALGEKGRLTAPPNPWVGALVVREGKVLGSGFHRAPGEPHAEINALREAGALAKGSTVYITLEPCAHQGSTPPCTTALIQAGVSRVVIPFLDPNPLVNGKGIKALKDAGIDVSVGLGAEEASHSLAPYLHFHQTRLPFCVLKAAVSLDGRVAAADGSSQWITGEEARADAHLLRAHSQAVLVGAKTALRDRPRLTVRSIPMGKQPLRVILDSKGSVPPLFDAKEAPVLFFTTNHCPSQRVEEWRKAGYDVEVCSNKIALEQVLESLAKRNVLQLLVEGGSQIFSAFIQEGHVQRLILYFGNIFLGPKGKPLQEALCPNTIQNAHPWSCEKMSLLNHDLKAEYSHASPSP